MSIGAAIIANNEAKCLARALESISLWVDQIVIGVDNKSLDSTLDIACTFTPDVFRFDFIGFGPTRNLAISKLCTDWVFVIDPDEIILKSHGPTIKELITNSADTDAFYFTRRHWFDLEMTKEWMYPYPDHHLRLFKKVPQIRYEGLVHENVVGYSNKILGHPLEIQHFNMYYRSQADWDSKNKLYNDLSKGIL